MKRHPRTLAAAATAVIAVLGVSCGQPSTTSSSSTSSAGTSSAPPSLANRPAGSTAPSTRPENQCQNMPTDKERQDCFEKARAGGMGSTAAKPPSAPASIASGVAP